MLVALGILIMVMYLAILLSADDSNLLEEMLHSELSEWFSVWFAPVCGVVSIIFLFILVSTSIRYTQEKMIIKYPLRKPCELYWRDIQKTEVIWEKRRGEEVWKKLRFYTAEKVYVFNLQLLTNGKDGFMTELFKMIKRYEIPYTEVRK